jgi:phospholipid/cholesterol/gamma-HCH transport system substrate-binding protein
VFLGVAAIGTSIVGGQYVGLDRHLWNRPYEVTLELANSGGIFPNAEVTYRGQAVGRVSELHLTKNGVAVDLAVNKGTKVPADVTAVVANRSAIGEQYVDFQPRSDGPPWLADGSTIAADDSKVPPRLEDVLVRVKELSASVDQQSLRTLVTELGAGLGGVGPDLRRIVDHTDSLVRTLRRALPETRRLLASGQTVLRTQKESSSDLARWSADLRDLAGAVAHSDASVRKLLKRTSSTVPELEKLITDNDQQLPLLMRDLVTVGDIVRARLPGIRVFLVAFPRLIQNTFNVVQGDGYVHFELVLDYSTGVCTSVGYRHTVKAPQAKPVADLGNPSKRADLNGYCAEPPGGITTVRGSQNVPKLPGDTYDPASQQANNPRLGRIGPDDVPPVSYERDGRMAKQPSPRVMPASLDRRTGVVSTTEGPLAVLGDLRPRAANSGVSESWQWLLLGPILPAVKS